MLSQAFLNYSFFMQSEKTVEERRDELLKRAYDKFDIKLSNVRVTLGNDYQTSMKCLEVPSSPCHILRPTGMAIQVHKSSISDIQLPKFVFLLLLP